MLNYRLNQYRHRYGLNNPAHLGLSALVVFFIAAVMVLVMFNVLEQLTCEHPRYVPGLVCQTLDQGGGMTIQTCVEGPVYDGCND